MRRAVLPDERIVEVRILADTWGGFVHVRQLRDQIEEGRTAIAATVVEASDGRVSVRLPGQANQRSYPVVPEEHVDQLGCWT
ncbi:MAG TPA: hypothetical protein VJS92_16225 [Candidatus Polarisedimenticolaceae bacterium]|nr:hypothetical protein [Candidatus Polarisedimenticolaceae bacterium]